MHKKVGFLLLFLILLIGSTLIITRSAKAQVIPPGYLAWANPLNNSFENDFTSWVTYIENPSSSFPWGIITGAPYEGFKVAELRFYEDLLPGSNFLRLTGTTDILPTSECGGTVFHEARVAVRSGEVSPVGLQAYIMWLDINGQPTAPPVEVGLWDDL
jgi:hypothetical protein